MVVKFACELAAFHKNKGDQILMIIKEENYSEQFYEMLLKRLIFTKEQIEIFKKRADELNQNKMQKAKDKKAKEIKEQTVANAKKLAETELLQVKEEGETLKKKACEKTEQETEALKALAQGKEEEAVSAVMKALL